LLTVAMDTFAFLAISFIDTMMQNPCVFEIVFRDEIIAILRFFAI